MAPTYKIAVVQLHMEVRLLLYLCYYCLFTCSEVEIMLVLC
jgi:hypothetical protein